MPPEGADEGDLRSTARRIVRQTPLKILFYIQIRKTQHFDLKICLQKMGPHLVILKCILFVMLCSI